MAKQTWTSRIRHDSDAMFREWGSDFSAKLALIGLVQTSDTGQINWVTVARGASAGYEIWRFDDALQATAPIFLKFVYGGATSPSITVQAGTASNGSGTLSGTTLTTAQELKVASTGTWTSDTAAASYFALKDGQLALAFKVTNSNYNSVGNGFGGIFTLSRTVDSAGAPTATGAMVTWTNGNNGSSLASVALRYAATAAIYTLQTTTANAFLGFFAGNPSTTLVGTDIQAALGFTRTPRMEPLLSPCGILEGEVAFGSTFTATLIGSTPRTYLMLDKSNLFNNTSTNPLRFAILWET